MCSVFSKRCKTVQIVYSVRYVGITISDTKGNRWPLALLGVILWHKCTRCHCTMSNNDATTMYKWTNRNTHTLCESMSISFACAALCLLWYGLRWSLHKRYKCWMSNVWMKRKSKVKVYSDYINALYEFAIWVSVCALSMFEFQRLQTVVQSCIFCIFSEVACYCT